MIRIPYRMMLDLMLRKLGILEAEYRLNSR
jgi:hypothetical protein